MFEVAFVTDGRVKSSKLSFRSNYRVENMYVYTVLFAMFVKFVFIFALKLSSSSLPCTRQVGKVGKLGRREFFISDVIGTWGQ